MNRQQSTRLDALEALIHYDESTISMKTILREMQIASVDFAEKAIQAQNLSLSVIRFRNTIDFVIAKSMKQNKIDKLSTRDRNLLRLAVYEVKILHANSDETLSNYPELRSKYRDEFLRAIGFDLNRLIELMPVANHLSLKYSHPTFLVKTLLDNLSKSEVIELLRKNNEKRTYYIRPNLFYDEHEIVLDSFVNAKFEQDLDVPGIYRIVEGVDTVVSSPLFKDGRVLIQDKASVLTVNALDPKPGQKIWDACAAPGMKTQLIAERMAGVGEIVASDIYEDRVKAARNLSRHLRVPGVEWIYSDASKPAVHDADKILIDAPCTSTGILQSYPSFKWRLNKETLFALMTVQNKILDAIISAYAKRPGTEIVFSTCSILPHEGESQIDSVLKRHDVELLQPLEYGNRGYPGFNCTEMVTRLFPHRHNSSGFFIARLRIKQ